MSSSRSPEASRWPHIGWLLFRLLSVAGLIGAAWFLLQHAPYRIDIDVYRMGGEAWLHGRPLYSDVFATRIGLNLPFTYPPLAAIAFSPLALVSLSAASVTITLLTLVLLVVAVAILLTGLDVWPSTTVPRQSMWLRNVWLAVAIVAVAAVLLEPIRSNFNFGQVNVVLMTLVIADCVPRRTPWPRGMLLGLAIALKLTPAVFLLYFTLRRDGRAVLTATVSFVLATLAGFALAWRDSWEYWTTTVLDTDRIGGATLNSNQNIAGALARLGLSQETRFVLWTMACFAVLALTIWAVRRVLGAGEPIVALICVALFGLMVSPVSWSHHWVWVLPTVVVTAVVAYRRRSAALWAMTAIGVLLMVWTPFDLMPKDHEPTAALWRQLAGLSYVWWALAVIVVSGLAVRVKAAAPLPVTATQRPVPAVG